MPANNTAVPIPKFKLDLKAPYSTFKHGKPVPVPFVIDGLLTQAGFSILAGKPKLGKTSLSRAEAVAVAKGQSFFGRGTIKGEVLLISLEDPDNHVDNCLQALDWNAETDATIHIVTKLAPSITESIEAIGQALAALPKVRLVIIDTLAKLLRVKDLNDYSDVMPHVEKVHDLARRFPHLHIQGLVHCVKAKRDNPFDALLGSTALRGETDTNIVLYEEGMERVIAAEVRQGRGIDPVIFTAQLIDVAGSNVVKSYSLGQDVSVWKADVSSKKESKQKETIEDRVIQYMKNQPNGSETYAMLLEEVVGNKTSKIAAITKLIESGVLISTGEKQNNKNPTFLRLDNNALQTYEFGAKFPATAV